MIRILIADDHKIMSEGLKSLFDDDLDIEVVTTVCNGLEALEVLKKEDIDVILLDIDMPKMNGIDCAREILLDHPETKIAILTMHHEKSLIKSLVKMGVCAYMLKTIPREELHLAIKTIYKGGEYFNADVTKALLNKEEKGKVVLGINPLISKLTTREVEVIKLIAGGMTNTQIGEKLFISPRTADAHRTNIMKKIDVHNVAGIVRFAFQNNLMELE